MSGRVACRPPPLLLLLFALVAAVSESSTCTWTVVQLFDTKITVFPLFCFSVQFFCVFFPSPWLSFPLPSSLSPSLVSSLLTKREFCATITRIFSALAPLLISIFRLSPSPSISLCLPLYYSGWQSSCHELDNFCPVRWPKPKPLAILPWIHFCDNSFFDCCQNDTLSYGAWHMLRKSEIWVCVAQICTPPLRLRLVGHSLWNLSALQCISLRPLQLLAQFGSVWFYAVYGQCQSSAANCKSTDLCQRVGRVGMSRGSDTSPAT